MTHQLTRAMRPSIMLLALACAAPLAAGAQQPRLGTVSFPTSGRGEAQARFTTGVLYLHSFEYELAAQAFRETQNLDPAFAMAYWGEAMTHNHPLWNQRDREAAMAALRRLGPGPAERRAKAPTEREKLWLDAVEALWAEGLKPQRDTAYAEAMERLTRAFPDDAEARSFYALALMGLSQGTRNMPTYMRAAGMLEELYAANPGHPGVLHYLIHCYDDPSHAPLGLRSARAYSRVAPDAGHAQHMTTHIFLAMGMWELVVSQNEIAASVAGSRELPGHYTGWLGYGLLQRGQWDAARRHLERVRAGMDPANSRQRGELVAMRAHYLINTERWDDAASSWSLNTDDLGPVIASIDAFARGYAALRRGDRGAARAELARLERAAAGSNSQGPIASAALRDLLAASLLFHSGRPDSAVALARRAAQLEESAPFEFGPPDIVKPSRELAGEMLLAMRRPAEAQREFEQALALAPRRALSLLGLARAAAAAGDQAAAQHARAELREVWREAEPGLPWLEEARREPVIGNRD